MSRMSPVTAEAKIFYLCTLAVMHVMLVLTIMLFICTHGNMAVSKRKLKFITKLPGATF